MRVVKPVKDGEGRVANGDRGRVHGRTGIAGNECTDRVARVAASAKTKATEPQWPP
jgi:hypothetical protein